MKFATMRDGGERIWGAVKGEGFVALSPAFPDWAGLRDVIAGCGLAQIAAAAAGRAPSHALDDLTYDLPLPDPEKIICVGVNFPDRNAEYRDGQAAPANPSLFVRFPRSFVGHGQPIIRPRASDKLDYEGEIAVVIGRGGRHIAEAEAWSHIAAATLCNEGTLRDWVRHAKFNVTQGKNFDASGAMGPWLVPVTGPEMLADVRLSTRVNGETRQDDRTSRMIFPIPRQIAYISTFTTLVPGDIIVTGTPTGAGSRRDPPVYLQPGDMVEVEAEGLGILRNDVADER